MSNATGPFGLMPIGHLDGSPWNGKTEPCYIGAGYAVALFLGDPVLLSPTLTEKDATGRYQTINKSAGTAGLIVYGIINSFEPLVTDLTKVYNPASTERIANVITDPTVVYAVRGCGGGTPSAVFIGQNAVMKQIASGSTVTGRSGMALDEGTTTAPTVTQNFTLHIRGIVDKPDNTLADNAVYRVSLNTQKNATGDVLGVTAS